ncbi:beta-1,4-glucuronyltransferase 1-like [Paramacrobiotus metropolitanus]|uniref:beta-1,4-glucuronyltransferase 1-like n=1 Tax=Paramacrobiotus metropolitanus TaxID=2943436 RepID=UPI002445C37C|nr:beta-1,4-glucuronyltransferase 1-like [Paramacrobiotus metropolitanus]
MICRARRRRYWTFCAVLLILILFAFSLHTPTNEKLRNIFCNDAVDPDPPAAEQSSFVLDTSGTYRIFPDVFSAHAPPPAPAVLTLLTHTSLNNLRYVPRLVERWTAGMAVAVFVPPGLLGEIREVLDGMRRCYPLVAEYVTFHVVSPGVGEKGGLGRRGKGELRGCNGSLPLRYWELVISGQWASQNYNLDHPYPNNLLRNVARRFTLSQFYLTIDVDMLPSGDLYTDFLAFLSPFNYTLATPPLDHQVFVLPAFELRRPDTTPAHKPQLLTQMHQLQARPFYFEMCWKCQQPTDYRRWETAPTEGKMAVAYDVEWRDPWEPFVIVHRSAPWFDERFKQYGFNRISHACELFVAGYKFSVLDTAFVMHLGFKTSDNFHQTKTEELNQNRRLFAIFKEELRMKYPDSTRKCE